MVSHGDTVNACAQMFESLDLIWWLWCFSEFLRAAVFPVLVILRQRLDMGTFQTVNSGQTDR